VAVIRALVVLALATPAFADRAFVGMHDAFVVFDGKTAKRPFKSPRFALHIAQAKPEVLWIGSTLSVHRWNAGTLDEKLARTALYLRVANDVMWLGNQKELVWFDTQWNDLALPGATESLRDLEVDDQGRAWILLGARLLSTKGDKWTTVVGPPDEDLLACKLAARGDLYIACAETVYRYASNTWTSVAKHVRVVVEDIYVGDAIYVIGAGKLLTGDRAIELPRWKLNGFTVDATGRMWFATDRGLTVLDATGKKLKLPRALATKGQVHAIHVEGVGPKL
jgi:ligand-binding sensor domain-containing protein